MRLFRQFVAMLSKHQDVTWRDVLSSYAEFGRAMVLLLFGIVYLISNLILFCRAFGNLSVWRLLMVKLIVLEFVYLVHS